MGLRGGAKLCPSPNQKGKNRMKKIIASLLSAAMLLSLLTFPAAAYTPSLTPETAGQYLKAIQAVPRWPVDSYLADFDGDGADELLLAYQDAYGSCGQYQVWKGAKKLAERQEMNRLTLCTRNGRAYLQTYNMLLMDETYRYYTLSGGEWVQTEQLEYLAEGSHYRIDGRETTKEEYTVTLESYREDTKLNLWDEREDSVEKELLEAMDLKLDAPDVLSTLPAGEKKALFDDLLFHLYGQSFETGKMSDRDIDSILYNTWFDTDLPVPMSMPEGYDGPNYATEKALTAYTQQIFGRTLNYQNFAIGHQPDFEDTGYESVYYQGKFYYCSPQRGSDVTETLATRAKHLYALGRNRYAAQFIVEREDRDYVQTAVVERNANGTWRIVRLYENAAVPSAAALNAYTQPSSWAAAEVKAAEQLGLVPALTGDPHWQQRTTRLQFAELVVNLVEQLTGETIVPAPADTFTDCASPAVLKANAAGIINGIGHGEFGPDQTTNREQIAAMVARAIDYVKAETGTDLAPKAPDLAKFRDKNTISPWAAEAMGRLAANGAMNGTGKSTISPKVPCAVEQSVLLLYRLHQKF